MSQKIIRQQNNLSIVFDYLDRLYYESSEPIPYKLFPTYYPYYFNDLIKLFTNYSSSFNYLKATSNTEVYKPKLPKYNSKNMIVCFSGGKDSATTALHYKKLGYSVYLYHLKNINKAYPKEYENAEKLAQQLDMPLYIEEITLSGNHIYTEHPMKNIIIANSALQFGIRNNISIKIAFGNYYTALLKDNKFNICAGDCRDMWVIYERIIQHIIPKFKMYIPLRNIKTTLKSLETHKYLLSNCCSCISPYRYRNYWKAQNESKYNITLPKNRCGNCWKCAVEYIYYTDNNIWEYNEEYYKHCLRVLYKNNIKEEKIIYSIYGLWNDYLFYPIKKSKLRGIENAVIQASTIKFT